VVSTVHFVLAWLAVWRRRRFIMQQPFNPGWAAFTFPVASTATAAVMFAGETAALHPIAVAYAWLQVALGFCLPGYVIIRYCCHLTTWCTPTSDAEEASETSRRPPPISTGSSPLGASRAGESGQGAHPWQSAHLSIMMGALTFGPSGELRREQGLTYGYEAPIPYSVVGEDERAWWEFEIMTTATFHELFEQANTEWEVAVPEIPQNSPPVMQGKERFVMRAPDGTTVGRTRDRAWTVSVTDLGRRRNTISSRGQFGGTMHNRSQGFSVLRVEEGGRFDFSSQSRRSQRRRRWSVSGENILSSPNAISGEGTLASRFAALERDGQYTPASPRIQRNQRARTPQPSQPPLTVSTRPHVSPLAVSTRTHLPLSREDVSMSAANESAPAVHAAGVVSPVDCEPRQVI